MSRKPISAPVKPKGSTSIDEQIQALQRQQDAVLAECRLDLFDRELEELSRKTYKRPLVLFFGRQSFSDNTKYLYLEAVRSLSDCDVVWCTANTALAAQLTAHGLPCLDMTADPVVTTRELLQCSVAVFCENMLSTFQFNPGLAGALAGAQKIQLWHGISVKHLDLMLLPHANPLDTAWRRTIRYAARPDVFLSTSSALDSFWVRAHGGSQLVRAGQPRNAVLFRDPTPLERIGAEVSPSQQAILEAPDRRRVLVAPTWKRGQGLFTSAGAFYQRLAAWARANDTVVFLKAHPFMAAAERPASIPGVFEVLDATVDVYPWLTRFHAMITDYSSIMFDFLLTGCPILTYEQASPAFAFEPDWSLVPDTPFRYPFDERTLEAVLDTNIATHPLAASQQTMAAQLYETDPRTANEELVRVIVACHMAAVDRPVDVIEMDAEDVALV
jgi:CDP-glycerol glycerophosphotransferase (TagB/SpsB family)